MIKTLVASLGSERFYKSTFRAFSTLVGQFVLPVASNLHGSEGKRTLLDEDLQRRQGKEEFTRRTFLLKTEEICSPVPRLSSARPKTSRRLQRGNAAVVAFARCPSFRGLGQREFTMYTTRVPPSSISFPSLTGSLFYVHLNSFANFYILIVTLNAGHWFTNIYAFVHTPTSVGFFTLLRSIIFFESPFTKVHMRARFVYTYT